MKKIELKRIIRKIGKAEFYLCLYDRVKCYAIGKQGIEQIAIFDYNDALLNHILDIFDSGATVQLYYNGTMGVKTLSEHVPLAKMFFSLYHPMESTNGKLVMHTAVDRDGNVEDCRSCNLYCGTATTYRDAIKNSEGDVILESLVLESNKNGYKDYFDLESRIEEILNSNELILEWTSGARRVLCTVRGTDIRFPLSYLAFLVYYGDTNLDNYKEHIQILKESNTKYGLSIEHLDGDYHNHRKYNLALVPKSLNSEKNNKISRIKEPHCFVVVNDGEKFKMVVGNLSDDGMLSYNLFMCERFETVVQFLNEYIKLYSGNVRSNKEHDYNEGLFTYPVFCKALMNTSDERFTSLDELLEG